MKRFRKYKKDKIIGLIGKTSVLSALIFLGGFGIASAWSLAEFAGLPSWNEMQILMADGILSMAATLLKLAGIFFNYTITFTIDFAEVVKNVAVVDIGWKIFRDFSNMVFIFILLAISIATILGIQSYNAKTLLKNVILVALLINFSLFATKVVIDAANVFTVGFYNKTIEKVNVEERDAWDRGISSVFSSGLKLHTIYKYDVTTKEQSEAKNIWTICAFGSIFLVITAFVFFAAGILFIKRMVILMFLMIISPLAFLGMILPATSGYSRQWWQMLFKESFYAPLYMMFTFVVASGINSDEFRKSIGRKSDSNDFVNVIGSTDLAVGGGAEYVIFNYILITGLMLASIIIASKLGASGAEGMIKMGKGAQKWGQGKIAGGLGAGTFGAGGRLGRRTVGSWAQKGADKMKDSNFAMTGTGKLALKTLRNVGDRSFDVRSTEMGKKMKMGEGLKGGYKTKRDKAKTDEIAYARSLGDPEDYARKKALGPTKRADKNIFYRMAVPAASGATSTTYEGQREATQNLVAEYDAKRNLKETQKALATAKNTSRTQKDLLDRAKKVGKQKDMTELYANKNRAGGEEDTLKQSVEDAKKAYEKIKKQLL